MCKPCLVASSLSCFLVPAVEEYPNRMMLPLPYLTVQMVATG